MKVTDLWPRRRPDLPPGQGAVQAFPRFSDKPLRWAPPLAPIDLRFSVNGGQVGTLGAAELDQFESVEQVSDFHCVTTWSYRNARWGGVRLKAVAAAVLGERVEEGQGLPYALATGADGQAATFHCADLLAPDVLLATHLDGQPLSRAHGAPLRIVSPSQYGYKNLKHLTSIDFRSTPPESTLGPKEHPRARVDLEERHATLPNWAVRIPYRLSIIPTSLAAERALRKSPR